jgi:hypothetical protein
VAGIVFRYAEAAQSNDITAKSESASIAFELY